MQGNGLLHCPCGKRKTLCSGRLTDGKRHRHLSKKQFYQNRSLTQQPMTMTAARKDTYRKRRRSSFVQTNGGSWGPSVWILLSVVSWGPRNVTPFHLDLHPTQQLSERRRQRRNRRLQLNNSTYNATLVQESFPSGWFHPKVSAVYATLPKEDDSSAAAAEFQRYRHYSRYERLHRENTGLGFGDVQDVYNTTTDGRSRSQRQRRLQQSYQLKATSLKGGRYSSYVAAPLSQGYGTHYANVWVGSPHAQRKSVIVDTGSHYTAFPCKGCESCGEEHHTDPYFDPTQSETFRPLSCNECQLGAMCRNNVCSFSQSYTEGSSWEAYQVQDMLYLGGRNVLDSADPRNKKFAIPFLFGCQMSETGLFVTQLADGIMGMSAHEFTLTKQLFDQGKVEHNMFSLCFRRELGTSKKGVTAGGMTLGGMDNRLDHSPMMFAKNVATSGWFTVYVKNIFIRAGGGESATSKTGPNEHVLKIPLDLSAVNSGKGVIVDSGTTDTYLHKKLAKSFAGVWKQVTKKEYSHAGIVLTDDQLKRLPTILVQMRSYNERPDPSLGDPKGIVGLVGSLDPTSPYDVLLAIPATHYMEFSPSSGMYTSRLYFTETQGGVLGANAMQGHNVVFDWENGRVGFAESSCEYQDIHSSAQLEEAAPKSRGEEAFGNDCVLRKPVLSQACVESVDTAFCSANGNRILEGTEIWTWTIESVGTSTGMSCPDVILVETPFRGDDPPKTFCEKGICLEFRKCELSCNDSLGATAMTKEEGTQDPGCQNSWSACDYSCTQSIIGTVHKSDGQCHEVSRDERKCHTGACANNDPCRVPYLVHAVLGLRGALRELWQPHHVELLRQTIVKTVHSMSDRELNFDVGDVNILMTAPWKDDSSNEEVGLKVVLQISFFNPNAQVVIAEKKEDGDANTDDGSSSHRGASETTETEESGGKMTLKNTLASMPYMFHRQNTITSTCVEDDLYPMAYDSLAVNDVFQKASFVQKLVGELRESDKKDRKSPFMMLYNQPNLIAESQVLSSWTIRTEVEDGGVVPKTIFKPTQFGSFAVSGQAFWVGMCFAVMTVGWIVEKILLMRKEHRSRVKVRTMASTSAGLRDEEHRSLLGHSPVSIGTGVRRADRKRYFELFPPRQSGEERRRMNELYFSDDDDDDSTMASLNNVSDRSFSERRHGWSKVARSLGDTLRSNTKMT